MVARAIVEGDRGWQLFAPFALVWAGGKLGRTAQQLSDWAHRSRESLEGGLARRREMKRLRAEAAKIAAVASPPVAPELLPEPIVEPVAVAIPQPVAAEAEPAPAVAVEAPPYDVTEGQSGGAAPPIPEAAEPTAEPVTPRRAKRGKKRKRKADAPDDTPPGNAGD